MVQKSLLAADKLAAEGIEAEVVDLRTLVPLDKENGAAFGGQDRPPAGAPTRTICPSGVSGEISAIIAEQLNHPEAQGAGRVRLAVPDCRSLQPPARAVRHSAGGRDCRRGATLDVTDLD